MKNILCESGFTFVWLQQETVNPKWLKGLLHKRLADINRQKWHNEINVNSHCESYQILSLSLSIIAWSREASLNTIPAIDVTKYTWRH